MENSLIHFSVIVPVYNVEPYLTECIESVLAQNYPRFTLILVDDGSTDASGNICDAYAAKDVRIRCVHRKNGGAAAARNSGLTYVTGDYVLFLDSDDYWADAQMLEKLAARLERTQADVLSFNFIKIFGERRSVPYFRNGGNAPVNLDADASCHYVMERGLWISSPCNKVIRTGCFNDGSLRFLEGIAMEDIDWNLRLALRAARFDYVEENFLCYRQLAGSASHSLDANKVTCLLSNVEHCMMLLKDAEKERRALLLPYIAYQYGTLLYALAALPKEEERDVLLEQVAEHKSLLAASANKKIRLLHAAERLVGLRGTLALLRIMQRLRRKAG